MLRKPRFNLPGIPQGKRRKKGTLLIVIVNFAPFKAIAWDIFVLESRS